MIEQPLIVQPGKTWIYSNFGYQLLGYIIERVNIDGFGYEQFVKKYFWEQVGINDIQVARPTLSEKSRFFFLREKISFVRSREIVLVI